MTPSPFDLESLLVEVRRIGASAARSIREIYADNFSVDYKQDGSPVTAADKVAHTIITEELAALQPNLPVLSEENSEIPFSERRGWEAYWLVDPLDGTKEFINQRDDFTVNIALIYRHHAILGAVYVPTEESCYAASMGNGAYRFINDQVTSLEARQLPIAEPVVAVSFSHARNKIKDFLRSLGPHKLLRRGSMIKCCLIAAAEADIYPRLGNTYEWDTAAGQCVLEEAGGRLTDWSGNPFRYNMKDSLINPPFVAFAPSAKARIHFDATRRTL